MSVQALVPTLQSETVKLVTLEALFRFGIVRQDTVMRLRFTVKQTASTYTIALCISALTADLQYR